MMANTVISAPAPASAASAPTLSQIISMRGNASTQSPENKANALREKAVFEASEIFGAQSGYCHEVLRHNAEVQSRAKILDQMFDFGALMLDGGKVLPPIIDQEDQTFYTDGPKYAVTTQKVWKIVQDPMIVSAAPDWRQYLLLTCNPPNQPNPLLLPVSSGDVSAWTQGAQQGWAAGVEQARQAAQMSLNRLVRDYTGMLRFTALYERGLVSAPILATGHAAVVLDGHTMQVGQTIYRLTRTTGFDVKAAEKMMQSGSGSADASK